MKFDNPKGAKHADMLREVIEKGKFETKSYLGNIFRDEHAKGTPKGDEYAALHRDEAAEFRLRWAERRLETVVQKNRMPRAGKEWTAPKAGTEPSAQSLWISAAGNMNQQWSGHQKL